MKESLFKVMVIRNDKGNCGLRVEGHLKDERKCAAVSAIMYFMEKMFREEKKAVRIEEDDGIKLVYLLGEADDRIRQAKEIISDITYEPDELCGDILQTQNLRIYKR